MSRENLADENFKLIKVNSDGTEGTEEVINFASLTVGMNVSKVIDETIDLYTNTLLFINRNS